VSGPVRAARFAGSWYPGEPEALRAEILGYQPADAVAGPAKAVVAPHAGYRFSGAIAAETYARVRVPEVAILLCPNHTVPPPVISVWPGGAWETPLGAIPVDEALVAAIQTECPEVVAETGAHLREHAIELHLPLLQVLQPGLRIVPVVVAAPGFAALERLGEGLARAIGERDDVLLVASSDMSHFETAARAKQKDELALERLLALDAPGLLETCAREDVSMCGVRPATAALVAALRLGATTAELVRYGHSGEVSGDHDRVVGYAGVVVR
jgi:AmmeMemoRadiSam system protein B